MPSNAVYCYRDIFGRKVYSSERRTYYVREFMNFGRLVKEIKSVSNR